ncbi:MAG: hypothetical protein GY765_13965, partial [bacterium]|nr:hypothetical protein [bacterium]
MIFVNKDHNKPPDILTGESCKEKIQEQLDSGTVSRPKFSDHYYGHDTVREALSNLYHHKCAYCETSPCASSELRVDHYRPKNKIKEVKVDKPHPGYYWLGYEWSNLIPGCDKCNNAKSNYFPLETGGKRVVAPPCETGQLDEQACLASSPALRAEKPLVLHPEVDRPEEHFVFMPNGEIKGITQRGRETIRVCKLNRKHLVLERKKIVDDVYKRFLRLVDLALPGKMEKKFSTHFNQLLTDVLGLQDPDRPYSRLGWFLFKK